MALPYLAISRRAKIESRKRQAATDLTAALRSVGGRAPEPSPAVLKRLSTQDRWTYELAKKNRTIYRVKPNAG